MLWCPCRGTCTSPWLGYASLSPAALPPLWPQARAACPRHCRGGSAAQLGSARGGRPPPLGSSQGLRGVVAGASRLAARPALASALPRPPPKLNLPSSSSLYGPKLLSWPAGAPSRLPERKALLPPAPLLLPPGVPTALRALAAAGVPGLPPRPLPFAAPLSPTRRLSLSLAAVRLGLSDAWLLASAPCSTHALSALDQRYGSILRCAGRAHACSVIDSSYCRQLLLYSPACCLPALDCPEPPAPAPSDAFGEGDDLNHCGANDGSASSSLGICTALSRAAVGGQGDGLPICLALTPHPGCAEPQLWWPVTDQDCLLATHESGQCQACCLMREGSGWPVSEGHTLNSLIQIHRIGVLY